MAAPNAFSDTDFGPEFIATEVPEQPAPEQPTTTRAKKKAEKEGIFSNLGKNSPARSNVRKLTEDDARKLAERYTWAANMVKMFHPRLSLALDENAERCAESWMNLAENNVKVRAKILAFLEGGEIMGVAMAHAPLLVAALPEKYVAMFMSSIMNAFANFTRGTSEPEYSDEPYETMAPPYNGDRFSQTFNVSTIPRVE